MLSGVDLCAETPAYSKGSRWSLLCLPTATPACRPVSLPYPPVDRDSVSEAFSLLLPFMLLCAGESLVFPFLYDYM